MIARTVAVEIPFQTLLNAIDNLTPDEKLALKKRLEKSAAATWKDRFGKSLSQTARKNKRASADEVANDVRLAIVESRAGAKN